MSDQDMNEEIIRELYRGIEVLKTRTESLEKLQDKTALLKEEVDSLQVVSQHLVRPWWRDGATLVASLAFIFSLSTTVFSFIQSENTRIGQAKSELRSLIVELNKKQNELSAIPLKYKNPITLAEQSASKNEEIGVIAFQASSIAKDIESNVTSVEHINIGKSLSQIDSHTELSEEHYVLALKVANTPQEKASAYLFLARLKFNLGEFEQGRKAFSNGMMDIGKDVNKLKRISALYYNSQLEMFWAEAEGRANFCKKFHMHIAKAHDTAKLLSGKLTKKGLPAQINAQSKRYCNSTLTNNAQSRQAVIPQIQELPRKVARPKAGKNFNPSLTEQNTIKVTDVSDCPVTAAKMPQGPTAEIFKQLPLKLFHGKFQGEIKGARVTEPVQVNLVRNNQIVSGAYLRQSVCGTVSGKLEKSILKFKYTWNGHKGNGTARQKNEIIYARDGNDFDSDKYPLLALQLAK